MAAVTEISPGVRVGPLLTAAERDRLRHLHGPWGLMIAQGLQHKQVWPGTCDETALLKRRARNRVARRSRAINRRRA